MILIDLNIWFGDFFKQAFEPDIPRIIIALQRFGIHDHPSEFNLHYIQDLIKLAFGNVKLLSQLRRPSGGLQTDQLIYPLYPVYLIDETHFTPNEVTNRRDIILFKTISTIKHSYTKFKVIFEKCKEFDDLFV